MPGTEYPMGTFPVQYNETSTPPIIQPNPGGPNNRYTGGSVFAGGTLQTTPQRALFDTTLGVLNWPYQGIRSGYSETPPHVLTQPGSGFGITKAKSNGTFAVMTKDQYIMLTFTSQIAGVANTLLQSPGNWNKKSQAVNIGYVNTVLINKGGGFYMFNGLPINPAFSRDNVGLETYPGTYAIPGRLSYLVGTQVPTTQSYHSKSD